MRTIGKDAGVIFTHRNARIVLFSATLFFICLPGSLFAAEPKPKPPAVVRPAKTPQQKAAQQQANKTQVQAANQQARAAAQALNAPYLTRLAQMSPEQRDAALAKLPPEQRQRLEQGLDNFAKKSPEEQARDLSQAQRLSALPPDRKLQARQSLNELRSAAAPRKRVILLELNKLGGMTDEERAGYMSKPNFQRRFSDAEIQMMNNLHGIVP